MGILHHPMVDHLLRRFEIGAHRCGWKHGHGSHVCTKTTKTGSSKLQFEPDWLRCQETLLMSTFISCADEFHSLLKDSKRSKAHCPMRLHAPPFVSDRNTQDYKLRHGSVHSTLWVSILTQRRYCSSRNYDTDFSARNSCPSWLFTNG